MKHMLVSGLVVCLALTACGGQATPTPWGLGNVWGLDNVQATLVPVDMSKVTPKFTPFLAATPVPGALVARVLVEELSVYSEPSEQSSVLRRLTKDTIVNIVRLSVDKEWGQLHDGGWVAMDYVWRTPPKPTPKPPKPTPTSRRGRIHIGMPADDLLATLGKGLATEVVGQDKNGLIVKWYYPDAVYTMKRWTEGGVECYRVAEIQTR